MVEAGMSRNWDSRKRKNKVQALGRGSRRGIQDGATEGPHEKKKAEPQASTRQ